VMTGAGTQGVAQVPKALRVVDVTELPSNVILQPMVILLPFAVDRFTRGGAPVSSR
jgi:hypothetical protein